MNDKTLNNRFARF